MRIAFPHAWPRPAALAALAAVALSLGLTACGGSSSSGASAQAAQGRGGLFSDPKVAACLKQHGVTLPNGLRRFRGRPRGTGTNPVPPSATGTNPARPPGNGARRRGFGGGNAAQFQKLRAALQACGVNFARPGGPGAGPQQGGGAPAAPTVPPSTTAQPSAIAPS